MKKFILAFICFFIVTESKAQANDTEAFFYNVSIGAVFGTIGSLINKKDGEKNSKIILKGLSEGALGGYLNFESKRLLRVAVKQENSNFYWGSKIINAAGNSILEGTALNRKFGEQWNMNIGFLRFEYNPTSTKKLKPRIMPIAFAYTIGVAVQTKFEIDTSLKTGQLIFSSNDKRFEQTNSIGVTYPGCIVLRDENKNELDILSHEIIHIYQQNDYSILNTFIDKPINKLSNVSNFTQSMNKILFYDFHLIPLNIVYNIESNKTFYYSNYLEHEAGFYSYTLVPNLKAQ